MGQYYKPCLLTRTGKSVKAWLYSHNYGNGLKLMEHSWLTNGFVETVESLLLPEGPWYKQRIVWAGDYADPESGTKDNLFDRATDKKKINPFEPKKLGKVWRYIVNHSKKEYVNKLDCKGTRDNSSGNVWTIHPLPLLTCEGNGRGGGDYHGNNKFVGSWARDVISVERTEPVGYKEIRPDFQEY